MTTFDIHFGVVDYCVAIAMLTVSTIIGLYYAWKARNTTDENEVIKG